jgi:hypothetical protein
MTRAMRDRLRSQEPDAGAYAILYAVLVVVLIGMGAIVVDFGAAREDRRLNRSASDAAALGGAAFLLPSGTINPNKACVTAWQYLNTTLGLSLSSGSITSNCTSFPSTYTTCPVDEIDQDVTIGTRTIRIAWPVPSSGGSGFLNADISPGKITQPFDSTAAAVDGSPEGCDRLGVSIDQHQAFGLGSALGVSSADTQVHSVALAQVKSGPGEVVAALNVLNAHDCFTLRATGGGRVYVDTTINADGTHAPGTIAVESDALTTGPSSGNCGGSDHVISAQGSGTLICANGNVGTVAVCDGRGAIYSHAIDVGSSRAYNPADVTAGTLSPKPIAEGGTHGYVPVTKRYGCNLTRLPACVPPKSPLPNYIAQLEAAYNTSPPTPYTGTQAPYASFYPFTGTFLNATTFGGCGTVSGTVTLPARGIGTSTGNWYCPAGINVTGKLIIPDGNLVLQNGDLSIANGGCFIINTAATTCTTGNIVGSGPTVTTNPAPTGSSTVYLKHGNFQASNGSSLLMPQTFVYAYGANAGTISFGATTVALWTAPGAGARDGLGYTTLEEACFDFVKSAVNEDCMNSSFARLAYWSDYPGTNTGANKDTFTGGASDTFVVGVFFTPTSYFNLAGSTSLPLISQFWADILDVNGGASLPLTPTDTAAVPIDIGTVGLIR